MLPMKSESFVFSLAVYGSKK